MNTFTASNGITLTRDESGRVSASTFSLTKESARALAEFFRAEEDERLGRWRWPTEPRFVVYPWYNADDPNPLIAIVDEGNGGQFTTTRATVSGTDTWAKVARAYFDAHPERKPWHDAKPGETWRLTVNDRSPVEMDLTFNVIGVEGVIPSRFARPQVGGEQMEYPLDSPAITAGRRIWPEVSS